jgi:hypothetical protein
MQKLNIKKQNDRSKFKIEAESRKTTNYTNNMKHGT